MRYLVTGGAGFIGSHLVDALVAGGHEVTVLDNGRRGRWEHLKRHIEDGSVLAIEGDVRDEGCAHKAMRNVEVVYHLAAQSNVPRGSCRPTLQLRYQRLGHVQRLARCNGGRRAAHRLLFIARGLR